MIIAYNIVEIPTVPGLACLLAYQHAVPEETWRFLWRHWECLGESPNPGHFNRDNGKYDNEPMDLQIPYFQTNYHMCQCSLRNEKRFFWVSSLQAHIEAMTCRTQEQRNTHPIHNSQDTLKTQPKKTIGKCETSLYAEFFLHLHGTSAITKRKMGKCM